MSSGYARPLILDMDVPRLGTNIALPYMVEMKI